MQKFDRKMQRILLEKMYELSPNGVDLSNINKYSELVHIFSVNEMPIDDACRIFKANVMYLEQHGLLESYYTHEQENPLFRWNPEKLSKIRITSKGIDFLLTDGGLGAILGVKTIKIHNETLDKFAEIIQNSDLEPEEKQTLSNLIREKGTEAVIGLLVDKIANNGGTFMSTILRLLISPAM